MAANLGTNSIAESVLVAGATGLGKCSFSAYRAAGLSLPASTTTVVFFDTEEWDLSSCYNPANGRFTPTTPGIYRLSGAITGSTGAANVEIAKNGSVIKRLGVGNTGGTAGGSVLVTANGSSDFFQLQGTVISAGAYALSPGQSLAYFQGELVGRQ